MPSGPLKPEQLDDIENWARAAIDDDPDDAFPSTIVQLIDENKELRELLRCDEDGQLASLVRLSKMHSELEERLKTEQQAVRQAKEQIKTLTEERDRASFRLAQYGAVLHKVEVLLNIARTRMENDGEVDTGPEEVGRLMTLVEKGYEKTKSDTRTKA